MSNDPQLNALLALGKALGGGYELVGASATAQVLGGLGAVGDVVSMLIIVPTATGAGLVTLLDNAVSLPIYAGGTVSAELRPMVIPLNIASVSGAWKVTTGLAVSVLAIGTFT